MFIALPVGSLLLQPFRGLKRSFVALFGLVPMARNASTILIGVCVVSPRTTWDGHHCTYMHAQALCAKLVIGVVEGKGSWKELLQNYISWGAPLD
jgi:hypothetical protein